MTLTLDLSPALIARAEARAAQEGLTLERFINELVARDLNRHPTSEGNGAERTGEQAAQRSGWLYEDVDGRPLPFRVFHGAVGFPPGVDPCSNASLSAAADAEEDETYLRIARGELS